MSLDVYLSGPEEMVECECDCGHKHTKPSRERFYDANYTHNCNTMAGEAGIYQCVWRPDENGITKASQLIEPLRNGIALMRSDPERFKKFNPKNGWGCYDSFILWLERYLQACEANSDADVDVSR